MKSEKILCFFLILLCIGFWIIAYLILGRWFTDDAFIAFRYANNFYNGLGLVFNAGQYVQGYTNFLWMIILICLKFLSIDFQTSAVLINLVSYLLLSFIVYCFLKKLFTAKSATFYFLSTIAIVSAPNLLAWVVGGGLEGPLFTTLLTVSFYFLLYKENKIICAVFFVLTTLTRPEGILFFFLALLYLLFFDESNRKKNISAFLFSYIIPIAGYFTWSYFYYDDILPNTFYAKVSLSLRGILEGIHYDYRYLMSSPFIFLLLVLSLFNIKNHSKEIKYFWIMFLIYIFYVTLVGGDFMFAFRFFLPILPFIYFLIINELGRLLVLLKIPFETKKFLYVIFVFLIMYNILSLNFFNDYKSRIKNYKMIQSGKILAEYFNNQYPSYFTIASSGIGALGFYSKMQILDVLGLTNKTIAKRGIMGDDPLFSHGKSNVGYILNKKPQIIVFGMPPGEKYPVRFAEKEIHYSQDFNKIYSYKETKIDSTIIARYYLLKNLLQNK
jgi:arabinofuranosyltransferase